MMHNVVQTYNRLGTVVWIHKIVYYILHILDCVLDSAAHSRSYLKLGRHFALYMYHNTLGINEPTNGCVKTLWELGWITRSGTNILIKAAKMGCSMQEYVLRMISGWDGIR